MQREAESEQRTRELQAGAFAWLILLTVPLSVPFAPISIPFSTFKIKLGGVKEFSAVFPAIFSSFFKIIEVVFVSLPVLNSVLILYRIFPVQFLRNEDAVNELGEQELNSE